MYESYYGLHDRPFSMLPDPGFLFLSRKHETALTLLQYALMNSAGFCVITGEPGAGKTTLLRKLLESVDDDMAVGMITNTHKSFGELLDWVLSAYSIHEPGLNKVEKNQKFVDFMLEQYANNKTTLLIVDEAQNMLPETLEELRMLSNINSEKDQLLQVILSGQPQLKDTLRTPELMQFAQRIAVDYHLDSLNLEETCGYIQHRLTVAGATKDVFTPKACEHIYQYSGGTPRLINLICDTALVYGFADQDETLDETIIDEMVQERMRDSVVPLFKQVESKDESPVREAQSAEEIDFPWIDPHGGTRGLKPEAEESDGEPAEKKTPEETAPDTDELTAASTQAVDDDADPADKDTAPDAASSDKEEVVEESTITVQPAPVEPARVETADSSWHEQTVQIHPEKQSDSRWKMFAYAVIALITVSLLVITALGLEDDEEQLAKEQRMQEQLERQQRMSSQLEDELQRIKRVQQENEAELRQQAEELQRQRDEALARAEEEAELRASREQQVDEIRQQIAATEADLKERARQAVEKERVSKQKIAASKVELESQLKEQKQRLSKLIDELEQARQQKEEVQQAVLQPSLVVEDVPVIRETAEPEVREEAAFESDPCSGPQAKFVSNCR